MKTLTLALLCNGIFGVAWAAEAPPPAAAPVVVTEVCPQPCCARKVCCPVETTLKQTKIVYGENCEEFCLPRCGLLPCGCTKCGHVMTKKVLIKKVITTECPSTKCVPVVCDH